MDKIEFNTQIATTIEQSKRLLELGLKPETADCTYWEPSEYEGYMLFPYGLEDTEENEVPAWSLHRLFAMICNYPSKEPFTFDFSMDFDSMEDVYDSVIEVIERHIKENNFNKEYLKGE